MMADHAKGRIYSPQKITQTMGSVPVSSQKKAVSSQNTVFQPMFCGFVGVLIQNKTAFGARRKLCDRCVKWQ
jgi:hypothetical protein